MIELRGVFDILRSSNFEPREKASWLETDALLPR